MNILVLLGGSSDEREVSLRSGAFVITSLQSSGHKVTEFDPASSYEGLADFKGKVDVVLPMLHGKGGEDGVVQKFLESYNIPYLGASAEVSKHCFDKVITKQAIKRFGYLTPKWEVVTKNNTSSPLWNKPYVIKPIDGGSSIDTFIVRDPAESLAKDVFNKHEQMLLEELIEGTEITVGILGDQVLPVVEIIPPSGMEFDYENKYNGATQELCPPPNVSGALQREAQAIAEHIHTKLGVRHLSRTDMIISRQGEIFVLELNTLPGMTDQSLFPKAAAAAGLSPSQLMQHLADLAVANT